MVTQVATRAQLPVAFFSGPLLSTGLRSFHVYPLTAGEGKPIRARRRSPQRAWYWPRIEINPPHVSAVILLDVDHERWPALLGEGLESSTPLPSWIVHSLESGHAHLAYVLEAPVHRGKNARRKPIRYLACVTDALVDFWQADFRYGQVLTRNPVAPGARCRATWTRGGPYSLSSLADALNLEHKQSLPKPSLNTAAGRNCALFDAAIKAAHRPRHGRVIKAGTGSSLPLVEEMNRGFAVPLDATEVGYIARSVDRYVARQWTERGLRERQQQRGIRSGEKRRAANAERDAAILAAYQAGKTQASIARELGISKSAIWRVLTRQQ